MLVLRSDIRCFLMFVPDPFAMEQPFGKLETNFKRESKVERRGFAASHQVGWVPILLEKTLPQPLQLFPKGSVCFRKVLRQKEWNKVGCLLGRYP